MSRADAVDALYQDMAARHRARFGSIAVCCLLNYADLYLTMHRSSRSLRSRRRTASVAPTSSSSSPRTSSSLCLTALSSPLARSCLPTRGRLPLLKRESLGSGARRVWMDGYVTAIACMKDTCHAACNYNPRNGMDGFDVSLVLCSETFKLFKKGLITGFLDYKCAYFRLVQVTTVISSVLTAGKSRRFVLLVIARNSGNCVMLVGNRSPSGSLNSLAPTNTFLLLHSTSSNCSSHSPIEPPKNVRSPRFQVRSSFQTGMFSANR